MTARRTAFARVPRGKTDSSAPNQTLPQIRVDSNFLERLERAKMSPDLATVMTKTDTKLSIDINAQAGVGYSLINKTGRTVADKADIQRIQNMGTSITKERKAALSDQLGLATKFLLVAFLQKSKETPDIREIVKFHKNFVTILRTVNTQYQMITKNNVVIEGIAPKDAAEETVKNILVEMSRRISFAVGKFLFHRASLGEEETPQKLNAFLFKEHVPIFIFSKLSSQLINTTAQGFSLISLFFPKDPSKGISLTFKEVRDERFRNDLMGLMEGSQLLIRLALNDDLIRLMINVKATTALDNFEEQNSLATKLANTPFYVVPFAGVTNATDYFGHLAKNGVRGTVWAAGTVLTPSDLLKYYGTIAKRVYHMLIARPMNKAGLVEEIFPGFTFDIEKEQEDIYVQLKSWALQPGREIAWMEGVRNFGENAEAIVTLRKVFNDVVMVNQDHPIAVEFAAMLIKPDCKIFAGAVTAEALLFTEVKNLALSIKDGGANPDDILGDRIAFSQNTAKKKGRTQDAGVAERSRLMPESREVVKELKNRRYDALGLRMSNWFRLFLDESVQSAVAALFLARLESFLENPLSLTREERHAFMEPGTNPEDEYKSEDEEEEEETPPLKPKGNADDD